MSEETPAPVAAPPVSVYLYHTFKLRPAVAKYVRPGKSVTLGGFGERLPAKGAATLLVEDRGLVPGEVVELTPEEVAELDAAEPEYRRIRVQTKFGDSWAYVRKDVRMRNHAAN